LRPLGGDVDEEIFQHDSSPRFLKKAPAAATRMVTEQ
jgi:hypothetical protein